MKNVGVIDATAAVVHCATETGKWACVQFMEVSFIIIGCLTCGDVVLREAASAMNYGYDALRWNGQTSAWTVVAQARRQ